MLAIKLIGVFMFKIIPNGINRLDIEMSGKLNSEEMKFALDELVSKSENIENGKMLYDVVDSEIGVSSSLLTHQGA